MYVVLTLYHIYIAIAMIFKSYFLKSFYCKQFLLVAAYQSCNFFKACNYSTIDQKRKFVAVYCVPSSQYTVTQVVMTMHITLQYVINFTHVRYLHQKEAAASLLSLCSNIFQLVKIAT